MNIVLDFTDVLSPGIKRLLTKFDACNEGLLKFFNDYNITMTPVYKASQRSLQLRFDNRKCDEVCDILSVMSERQPYLAYEIFLIKRKIKVRKVFSARFEEVNNPVNDLIIVLADSNKPVELYDLRGRLEPEHLSKIFNMKKEFSGSYSLSRDCGGSAFDKGNVRKYLLNAKVNHIDSWKGLLNRPIPSYSIWVDLGLKAPDAHSLEVKFEHSWPVQKVKIISELHRDQPLSLLDEEFTFIELSYWLNGISCNLHKQNFCNGFILDRFINYLKPEELEVLF